VGRFGAHIGRKDASLAKTIDFLAFDLGAASGRAVIGRFDGERLALEEIHRFPNGTSPVHTEKRGIFG